MKFSEKWLRELVKVKVSTDELVEALTMAGLELESLERLGNKFNGVIVGEVLAATQHPNADKLRVCQVLVAKDGEPLTIVCGASNVRAGLKVPVAMLNAKVGDIVIKKAKLRGVESQGMICSEKELGLALESPGIMELPEDAPLGMDVAKYLDVADNIIELNVTPNRGDCLSVLGVAREVAAIFALPVPEFAIQELSFQVASKLPITSHSEELCPHYIGQIIQGVNVKAKTPAWLQSKLEKSGVRSISIIVDITNYVLLELGQPLHAFDLAKIAQGIAIRLAKDGETLTLLDGKQLKLATKDLIIADAEKPLALAGVMGGEDSAVSETTQDIFLESAFFAPTSIAKTSKRYNLTSDSSHRFERGVDPALQVKAINRARELVLELAGGKAGPLNEIKIVKYLPKTAIVNVKAVNVKRILGVDIAGDEVATIFKRLNVVAKQLSDGWQVTPPSYRFDLVIEEDFIEEIARIYGYQNIPEKQPTLFMPGNSYFVASGLRRQQRYVMRLLASCGFNEVVTYSFVDNELQKLIAPNSNPLTLANPISAASAVMRTSLWPGLLQALLYNQKRKATNLQLYTSGHCFLADAENGELKQLPKLSGLIEINDYKSNWGENKLAKDHGYFVLKNTLEKIFSSLKLEQQITFVRESCDALHPGITARIYLDKKALGWIGKLHPGVAQQLDIVGAVYLFDLDINLLNEYRATPQFTAISKFPLVTRDIAIVVDAKLSWDKVCESIYQAGGQFLQDVELFDIYAGPGIELGKKSLAIHLILQKLSQTFTDEEIELVVTKIIKYLAKEFDATLRG